MCKIHARLVINWLLQPDTMLQFTNCKVQYDLVQVLWKLIVYKLQGKTDLRTHDWSFLARKLWCRSNILWICFTKLPKKNVFAFSKNVKHQEDHKSEMKIASPLFFWQRSEQTTESKLSEEKCVAQNMPWTWIIFVLKCLGNRHNRIRREVQQSLGSFFFLCQISYGLNAAWDFAYCFS